MARKQGYQKDCGNGKPGNAKGGSNFKPLPTGKGGKNARRFEEAADTEYKMSSSNDKSWYGRYKQLADDSGSISFGQPLGKVMSLPIIAGMNNPSVGWTPSQPNVSGAGIARINWVPGIGVSLNKQSPINRAALNIFVTLRSKQKAAHDYDSQDMMMGIMAVDSAYILFAVGRRLYGTARGLQTPENYYYTRTLIQAQGFDPDDVVKNLAKLRTYCNYYRSALEKYTLPNDLDLSDRHMWMCDGVYVDADNTRAQTFIFVPEYVYKYDNTVATGSQLIPVQFADNMTVDQYIAMCEAVLEAINGDDDIGWICGDLYAAYGSKAMRPLSEISDTYTVIPAYNEEVLAQITNIKFVGRFNSDTVHITQNPSVNAGAILWDPHFSLIDVNFGNRVWVGHMTHQTLINAHKGHDPLDVIEMTRLTPLAGSIFEGGWYSLSACGSEV